MGNNELSIYLNLIYLSGYKSNDDLSNKDKIKTHLSVLIIAINIYIYLQINVDRMKDRCGPRHRPMRSGTFLTRDGKVSLSFILKKLLIICWPKKILIILIYNDNVDQKKSTTIIRYILILINYQYKIFTLSTNNILLCMWFLR